MKRTVMVIMAMCAIGLSGCNRVHITSGTNTGSGSFEQKPVMEDSSTNVETNVETTINVGTSSKDSNAGTPSSQLFPLPLSNWYPWKGVTRKDGTTNNECIINSNGRLPSSAGIANEHLGTFLRGKTLILYFSNTSVSTFPDGLMAKVEADDQVIEPPAYTFPVEGFLPAGDTPANSGIEYRIPDTFNGKLNITFYPAELKDLKITAYYK